MSEPEHISGPIGRVLAEALNVCNPCKYVVENASVLREARKARGLSLRGLADRVGISHVYIGEVERGLKPMPESAIDTWSEAVGIDRAELWRLRALGMLASVERAADAWNEDHAEDAGFFVELRRMAG